MKKIMNMIFIEIREMVKNIMKKKIIQNTLLTLKMSPELNILKLKKKWIEI